MMYGKIENGKMTLAPSVITIDGFTYVNPTADTLISAWYVPLQFNPCLIQDALQVWTVVNGVGVQSWIEGDAVREPTAEERIEAQVMYTALMTDTLLIEEE